MKFEIYYQKRKEKYFFNLKAKNHQVILTSKGYDSIKTIIKVIKSVKKNSGDTNRFARKKISNRQYQFHLNALSTQTEIGHSQIYTTRWGMTKGIRSVQANAPEAIIIDKATGKEIK